MKDGVGMQIKNVIFKHSDYGYCIADLTIDNGIISNINIVDKFPSDFNNCEFYVTPGFVNSHLHPNQLFDRRLMDGLSITELLHQMHGNYQKTDEDRYVQALFVIMDAIKSGATSLYSVASNPYPVIRAYKAMNVKGAISCFYNDQWEGHGDSPALHQSIETEFLKVFEQKNDQFDIHIGSASVQSASNDLLVLLDSLAKRLNTKVNIHVSEGIESVKSCLKSRGLTPIRLLAKLGVLSERWNLIHAVNIDDEEISLIAKAGASVIHCPVSNAKTGVGIAPIKGLIEAGVLIGLGTDACSNNNTNNILNEAYFSTLIHSAKYEDPKLINCDRVMQWMTVNGNKILGNEYKSTIEVGNPADLLLWSLDNNAFVPLPFGNFESSLIFNAPDMKPHTILINGEVVVEKYSIKTVSEVEIRKSANTLSSKIFETFQEKLITSQA